MIPWTIIPLNSTSQYTSGYEYNNRNINFQNKKYMLQLSKSINNNVCNLVILACITELHYHL